MKTRLIISGNISFLLLVLTFSPLTSAYAQALSVSGEIKDNTSTASVWSDARNWNAVNPAPYTGALYLYSGAVSSAKASNHYARGSTAMFKAQADFGSVGVGASSVAGSIIAWPDDPGSYSRPWAQAGGGAMFTDAVKITSPTHNPGDHGKLLLPTWTTGFASQNAWATLTVNNMTHDIGGIPWAFYQINFVIDFIYGEWTSITVELGAGCQAYASDGSSMSSRSNFFNTVHLGEFHTCETDDTTKLVGDCIVATASGHHYTDPVKLSVSTETVEDSVVTQGGVIVSGSVIAGDSTTVTERGFVFGSSLNPTTDGNKVIVAGDTGDFSATLTDLLANTTYHVRAYAVSDSTTVYGEDQTFTTLVTSAEYLSDDRNCQIFPNPTSGMIKIYTSGNEPVIRVEIFSIQGQKITFVDLPESNTVDLSRLRTGIYVLKLVVTDKLITREIIKK